MAESQRDFAVTYHSPDEFDSVVELVERLVSTETLHWRVKPNRVVARIDIDRAQEELGELNRSCFEDILSTQVEHVLSRACLGEDVAPPLFMYFERRNAPLDEEQKLELRRREELVESRLVTSALRQRALIRRTTKAGGLDDVSWEVCIKKHDLHEGSLGTLPYGTLRLQFGGCPGGGDPSLNPFLRVFGLPTEPPKVVTADLHADDVATLIADLRHLHASLQALTEEQQ